MRINLINWEIEKGYKALYVANKLGINPSEYSLIKNGKRTPSIEFMYKFEEAFPNEDVMYLFRKVVENDERREN